MIKAKAAIRFDEEGELYDTKGEVVPEKKELPFHEAGVCCLGPNGWYVYDAASDSEAPLNDGDWVIKYVDGSYGVCPHDEFYSKHPELTEGGS